jgi:glucose-1-phosphate adenylyltransferase
MNDLHGIIFAYRPSQGLQELSAQRNTCSVPYSGRYRVIDFMLSNMVNAGISDVGLIVHASYQSLLDHVGSGKDWDLSRKHGGLKILPPFGYRRRRGDAEYRGRMDALVGVESYLKRIRQDYVVLANGDMAVNLPLRDIFEQHLKRGADITAVCSSVYRSEPDRSVYFIADENDMICDVTVNPVAPIGYESLEVYIMSSSLLLELVEHSATHNISSFSEGVLLRIGGTLKIAPYYFNGYSARLQTIAGYYAKSMELLDPKVRRDLFDPARPIRTKDQSNASTYYGPEGVARNSLIADGCIVEGEVENSILFRGVHVAPGAKISGCILMQSTVVEQDAVLKSVITDKNVHINAARTLMGHESYPLAIAKNSVV